MSCRSYTDFQAMAVGLGTFQSGPQLVSPVGQWWPETYVGLDAFMKIDFSSPCIACLIASCNQLDHKYITERISRYTFRRRWESHNITRSIHFRCFGNPSILKGHA